MSDKEIALELARLEVQLRCAMLQSNRLFKESALDIYENHLSIISADKLQEQKT